MNHILEDLFLGRIDVMESFNKNLQLF